MLSSFRFHTAAARMAKTARAQAQAPQVLVVGGGYGGVSVISNLLNLLTTGGKQLPCPVSIENLDVAPTVKPSITLLAERDGIFHTMGSPLSNVCRDFSREAWLKYEDIPYLQHPSVHVRRGRAHAIDPAKRIATYVDPRDNEVHTIAYDILVLAHGTHRPWPNVPVAQTKAQYLEDGDEFAARLGAARKVAVVGGGAVGVEMATSLKAKFPHLQVALIHSRDALLGSEPLPDEFKAKVLELVAQKGVETILGRRVTSSAVDDELSPAAAGQRLTLSDGQVLSFDVVLDSTGYLKTACQTVEAQQYLLQRSGNLAVQATRRSCRDLTDRCDHRTPKNRLQLSEDIPNAASHFAVGDAARWTGIKRAGNAMIMGQYAASNILKLLDWRLQQQQDLKEGEEEAPDGATSAEDDHSPPTTTPQLLRCPDFEPMMALSVGDEAIAYTKASGVIWGREIKEKLIGRGLGIDSKFVSFRNYRQDLADFFWKDVPSTSGSI